MDFAISVEQIKNKQTSVNCQKISLKTKLPQPVSEPGLKPCLLASLAGCLAGCFGLLLIDPLTMHICRRSFVIDYCVLAL